jgi:hypothetical protein
MTNSTLSDDDEGMAVTVVMSGVTIMMLFFVLVLVIRFKSISSSKSAAQIKLMMWRVGTANTTHLNSPNSPHCTPTHHNAWRLLPTTNSLTFAW